MVWVQGSDLQVSEVNSLTQSTLMDVCPHPAEIRILDIGIWVWGSRSRLWDERLVSKSYLNPGRAFDAWTADWSSVARKMVKIPYRAANASASEKYCSFAILGSEVTDKGRAFDSFDSACNLALTCQGRASQVSTAQQIDYIQGTSVPGFDSAADYIQGTSVPGFDSAAVVSLPGM